MVLVNEIPRIPDELIWHGLTRLHVGPWRGEPPHIGWWNARVKPFKDEHHWGWWDGRAWSAFATSDCDAAAAAVRARKIGMNNGACAHVEWRTFWPANARVPRYVPVAEIDVTDFSVRIVEWVPA